MISITFVPMDYDTFIFYLKIVKIIRFGILYFIFPISIWFLDGVPLMFYGFF